CIHPYHWGLFTRYGLTAVTTRRLEQERERLRAQLAMRDGALPPIPIGPHRRAPYVCPFLSRCWGDLPAHHVSTLYGAGTIVSALAAQGFTTIDRLPDDLPLRMLAERQRVAVQSGRRFVGAGLGAALAALRHPIAVLDFE